MVHNMRSWVQDLKDTLLAGSQRGGRRDDWVGAPGCHMWQIAKAGRKKASIAMLLNCPPRRSKTLREETGTAWSWLLWVGVEGMLVTLGWLLSWRIGKLYDERITGVANGAISEWPPSRLSRRVTLHKGAVPRVSLATSVTRVLATADTTWEASTAGTPSPRADTVWEMSSADAPSPFANTPWGLLPGARAPREKGWTTVEAIVGELVVAVEDCGWRISMEGTSTPTKATLLWEELTEVVPSPEEGQEMPMEGAPSPAAVKDPWEVLTTAPSPGMGR